MGAGTKVGQGKRRALVATFHAIGMESDAISETTGVPLRTVQDDIKNIREGKFFEKLPQELKAEIDGVASYVLAPLVDLLDHEEPGVRIAAARAIWAIFKDKVLLQRAFGLLDRVINPSRAQEIADGKIPPEPGAAKDQFMVSLIVDAIAKMNPERDEEKLEALRGEMKALALLGARKAARKQVIDVEPESSP